MPAIADSPDDPLGRDIGEEIESANPALHPPGYYAAKRATTSPYVWSSLFQQHPTAAEGGIFKRGDWRFWSPPTDGFTLDDVGWFRHVETARSSSPSTSPPSTKTSADFTVASVWAIPVSGDLVLLDRERQRARRPTTPR
jgi:hypothetical protein